MFRRLAAVILSVVLLSPGWLGMTGLTLPFAMIPLLWISASYGLCCSAGKRPKRFRRIW